MKNESKYSFDKLQMFFGEDYKIANGIIISQPSIGDILVFGEKKFYQVLNTFITNPTSMRVLLWENGVDWTKITDYELFIRLILQFKLNKEDTFLLFGELDFTQFAPYKRKKEETDSDGNEVYDTVLINEKQNVLIDEEIYMHIAHYLRTMFNIFPKVEKARDKTTKEWMIEEDMEKRRIEKDDDSTLLPMISFCLNHPGFKYNKQELRNLGIVEFNDSVQRLLVYESTTALMKGMYSGFVDTSKIDQKEFNFMRELK